MNNRLKFRAWDKEKKVMHYNDFVVTSTGYIAKLENIYKPHPEDDCEGELIENQFLIDQTDMSYNDNLVLMQYIGLKDSEGKEICEGDILEYKQHNGYLLPSFVSSVVYDNENASFGWFKDEFIQHFCEIDEIKEDLLSHITVIGNIYENPELLEVVNNEQK